VPAHSSASQEYENEEKNTRQEIASNLTFRLPSHFNYLSGNTRSGIEIFFGFDNNSETKSL
jgi:hypothetical protein